MLQLTISVGFTVTGSWLAEVILMMRTYAIWGRKKMIWVFFLFPIVAIISSAAITALEVRSLQFILTLTLVKAIPAFRRARSPLITNLYRDGILFYVYLLCMSSANVIVPLVTTADYTNILSTPQPSATILVYDYLRTLEDEISFVWNTPNPRLIATALFLVNRYLPFVETFVALHRLTTIISPERCLVQVTVVTCVSNHLSIVEYS
ncbi:hypothetical protein PUNSTDRAFT_136324 [Punctularia strigosozonata HHB-11173 SS5]|uniref:uncharacterized protein n=1 Tax=Punctularia strigosozonata (strain HHB-11173) TaxID=741275 RepID=UPI0004417BEC|nr:uncharacterized protein PUNSTDRAFT_136324 [Punctularia strigosozonata HHB-11173 SS5]EIN06464.1 hypothetical protein PUNSTDRAFT_136324 [Punctularia strigosozonata HHB-11173 SS5]